MTDHSWKASKNLDYWRFYIDHVIERDNLAIPPRDAHVTAVRDTKDSHPDLPQKALVGTVMKANPTLNPRWVVELCQV